MPRGNKTKVLVLIPFFNLGGAEKQAFYLAKALQNHPEYEVQIWSFQNGTGLLIPQILDNGIYHHNLNYSFENFNSRSGRIAIYLLFWYKLLMNRFDAIVPFTYHCNILSCSVFRWAFVKKCIWFQIAMEHHIPFNTFENFAKRMKPIYAANSKAAGQFIANRHGISPNQVKFIPNPFEYNSPSRTREEIRMKHGFNVSDKLLFIAANFYPEKNHETLIKAFALLTKTKNDLYLLLAGDNSNFAKVNELKSLAFDFGLSPNKIRFIGSISDMPSYLNAVDICLLTSVSEGSPNALLEYIGYKKPIVVSRIPAIVEIVTEEFPYLFEPENSDDLAQKILRCLEEIDSKEQMDLIEINFKKISLEYTVDSNQSAFLSIL